jgi:uncharacterized protein YqgV (UPF0045/DUF77 family)
MQAQQQQQQQRPQQAQQQAHEQQLHHQPQPMHAKTVAKVADQYAALGEAAELLFKQQHRDLSRVADRQKEAAALEAQLTGVREKLQAAAQRQAVLEGRLEATVDSNALKEKRLGSAEGAIDTLNDRVGLCQQLVGIGGRIHESVCGMQSALSHQSELGQQLSRVRGLLQGKSPAEWRSLAVDLDRKASMLATIENAIRTTGNVPDTFLPLLREWHEKDAACPLHVFTAPFDATSVQDLETVLGDIVSFDTAPQCEAFLRVCADVAAEAGSLDVALSPSFAAVQLGCDELRRQLQAAAALAAQEADLSAELDIQRQALGVVAAREADLSTRIAESEAAIAEAGREAERCCGERDELRRHYESAVAELEQNNAALAAVHATTAQVQAHVIIRAEAHAREIAELSARVAAVRTGINNLVLASSANQAQLFQATVDEQAIAAQLTAMDGALQRDSAILTTLTDICNRGEALFRLDSLRQGGSAATALEAVRLHFMELEQRMASCNVASDPRFASSLSGAQCDTTASGTPPAWICVASSLLAETQQAINAETAALEARSASIVESLRELGCEITGA